MKPLSDFLLSLVLLFSYLLKVDHLTHRVKELEEELSRKEGRWNTTHNRLLLFISIQVLLVLLFI